MVEENTEKDVTALLEVGVKPNSPTHSVVLIKESGHETVKDGLGIADAMRVAALQSRDLGGYAQVKFKDTILALYFKGEFIEMKYELEKRKDYNNAY